MFSSEIKEMAQQVIAEYTRQHRMIVTAEACTGGLIAAALTEIPGATQVLERGYIAYTPFAKHEILGVPTEILEQHGEVSTETVEAMAAGALDFSRAHVALSVTGFAGPAGGTDSQPVGLMYFGFATREGANFFFKSQFFGSREEIRGQTTLEALRLLLTISERRATDR